MESRFLSHGRAGEQGWRTNSRLISVSGCNNSARDSKARQEKGSHKRPQEPWQMLWQVTGYENSEPAVKEKVQGGNRTVGNSAVEESEFCEKWCEQQCWQWRGRQCSNIWLLGWDWKNGAPGRLQPFLSAGGECEEWLPCSQSWDACSSPDFEWWRFWVALAWVIRAGKHFQSFGICHRQQL